MCSCCTAYRQDAWHFSQPMMYNAQVKHTCIYYKNMYNPGSAALLSGSIKPIRRISCVATWLGRCLSIVKIQIFLMVYHFEVSINVECLVIWLELFWVASFIASYQKDRTTHTIPYRQECSHRHVL